MRISLLFTSAFFAAIALPCTAQPSSDPAAQTQTPAVASAGQEVPLLSLDNLSFLEGTWTAEAAGSGAQALGFYTFQRELDGHVLARHSATSECKATSAYDCAHRDLFYVFQDSPGAPLKAIYFDSEGHVIRYEASMRHGKVADGQQDAVVFLSDAAALGPRFRLMYERSMDTKTGKAALKGEFAMMLPDGSWRPYLQWVGVKR